MHISSYMLSLLLHLGLVLVVWLWPTSTMVQLDKPMMQISLTMGAPGGDRLPSPVLGPQGQPAPREASIKPAPVAGAQQQIAGEATALPSEAQPERLEAKAEVKPESQPREKPQPVETKPEPKPEPAPVPKPPDVALSNPQRKPEEKKPETKPKPKPEPETKPKPKPASETKPAPKPDKKPQPKAPSPQDVLAAALSDAKNKTGNAPATPRRGNASSSVAGALASAERKVRSEGAGGGGGGEGAGPGGGGIFDVYAGMVILAVRPNWSMPTYSRDQLVAQVRVRMDTSGNVLTASLERGSGRADFDASCVNAVLRTKVLPPPPPGQEEIVIGFNSLEMSGR